MSSKGKRKNEILRYLYVIIGCYCLAISLNIFLKPNNFVLGGATGIGIILNSVFETVFNIPFPVWLSNILINLPLFLIGYKIYGFKFIKNAILGTFFLSVALVSTEWLPKFTEDIFLACIFGALLDGIGLGLIIKNRFSTGGTDLLAYIINKFLKHIPLAKILFCIDGLIIFVGIITFGIKVTLYAMISVFIVSKVISTVVDGFDFAKAVYIISDKSEEIGDKILSIIDRGATAIQAKGMYTKKRKDIIFCVIKQKQIPELKEVIYDIDENAFVVISNVSEVVGLGFNKYAEQKF
ncbi:MAG: YitT family protein [Eubacteriales bacterium]|nr:YitT family protein [Eubacteriales bacterium]